MIEKVAFCMYPVKDLQRARQFYEEVLGLTPGLMTEIWVEYALPGIGSLALLATDGIHPSHTAGGSVALQVQDLDRSIEELKAQGVKFLTPEPIQSAVSRMQPIMDSEGNGLMIIEMLQNEEEPPVENEEVETAPTEAIVTTEVVGAPEYIEAVEPVEAESELSALEIPVSEASEFAASSEESFTEVPNASSHEEHGEEQEDDDESLYSD